MEANKKFITVFTILLAIGAPSFSQEYDDLYFTHKDRKAIKKKSFAQNPSKATYKSYEKDEYQEQYSAYDVNPEYLAKYRSNNGPVQYSPNDSGHYQKPSMFNISYYPDSKGTTIINNYYRNDPWLNGPRYGKQLGLWHEYVERSMAWLERSVAWLERSVAWLERSVAWLETIHGLDGTIHGLDGTLV